MHSLANSSLVKRWCIRPAEGKCFPLFDRAWKRMLCSHYSPNHLQGFVLGARGITSPNPCEKSVWVLSKVWFCCCLYYNFWRRKSLRFKIQCGRVTEIKKMQNAADVETWNKPVQLAVQASTTYQQYCSYAHGKEQTTMKAELWELLTTWLLSKVIIMFYWLLFKLTLWGIGREKYHTTNL